MVGVREKDHMAVVFSASVSFHSLAESYHRSAPETPSGVCRRAIPSKRVRELADIPRAAGLRDVTVDVSVAHAKSKLRARFFVEMTRETTMPKQSWGFGVSLLDVRKFELQMLDVAKKHYRANRNAERRGVKKCCSMCVQLNVEMRAWSTVKRWSALNPGNKERKCDKIKKFFEQLFDMLGKHAQWMHECDALRGILRMAEELSQMQYPHDGDAIDVVRSLRRVDINDREYAPSATKCTICLAKVDHFPEETADHGRACAVELPCGHRFHDTCICSWLRSRLDCPVCRSHVSAPSSRASSQRGY